jgi:signal transduction histidine kinase
VAVPIGDRGDALIGEFDPQALWQPTLAAEVGDQGYAYLMSDAGHSLAIRQGLTLKTSPDQFVVFKEARKGKAALRLYKGLEGKWVVGRGQPVRGSGYSVIVEMPLSGLLTPVVRLVALWLIALVLTAAIGEWLIRRVSRTVLGPLAVLSQGASAVTAGDYGYRVRAPVHTDRELAELIASFNSMIERLAESQRQIDAYNLKMQEIVDQRARELSRKATQLEVAAEVSSKIATNLDPRKLAEEVVDLIKTRFKVYHAEIALIDDKTGRIYPTHLRTRALFPELTLQDADRSVIAWVARKGEMVYVPDVTEEPRYLSTSGLTASRSELAIPLKFGSQVIGVLNLESDHRDGFPKDEMDVLESLANEIAVSLHNAQNFAALETANRDLAQGTLMANQANMLKSRFLFNASHKLRTPLNSIIGYSETILSGMYGDISDTLLDRQRRILDNGRHLQALIEDMLDLSAIETGQMQLNRQWLDLYALLDEVTNATRALYQAGFPGHDLTVRLDLTALKEPLPPIWADIERLRYILINLSSNAVKFTEEGEVVLSAEFDEKEVRLLIRDTGPGISEDDRRYLFEPFQHQRGSTTSEGKGTGLGLPVSRLLAMRHGGDLTVRSIPRQGSTFTLHLPLHPDGAPPIPED